MANKSRLSAYVPARPSPSDLTEIGCPGTPVRGVAQAARRPACLPPASAPEAPFCAAARVATAVVLARRSAPERVRPAAPTTPAAERGSACCSAGRWRPPALAPVAAPLTTLTRGTSRQIHPGSQFASQSTPRGRRLHLEESVILSEQAMLNTEGNDCGGGRDRTEHKVHHCRLYPDGVERACSGQNQAGHGTG